MSRIRDGARPPTHDGPVPDAAADPSPSHTHHDGPTQVGADRGPGYWDQRYRAHESVWSRQPNEQLVAEVSDLPPGRALDAGCGEGTDALWLAARGWHVTAVDFSAVAIARGAARAAAAGAEIAGRLAWVHADLTQWRPGQSAYDLVTSQFLHLAPDARRRVHEALVGAVAPSGTLLVVAHSPSDQHSGVGRPASPDVYATAGDLAALLGDDWTVQVCQPRPRLERDPQGRPVTVQDEVLLARRAARVSGQAGARAGNGRRR
jgi:SAM-dependent methyltransferase